ncbi:MAG: HD family phosphohydrolase [Gemmatimonadales bacterium]|nr:MAG: HD family phosphohydrolase [Gemmatimonadales bacterium]
MASPTEFLSSFAQALSALSLYPEGHRLRQRAVDTLYEKLQELVAEDRNPTFSFLGEEVLYGTVPIKELRGWQWSARLGEIGIERLQFEPSVTREELEDFLDEVLARLTLKAIDTAEVRQMRPSAIRYGMVGISDATEQQSDLVTATISFTLDEEAETIRWLHEELERGGGLHLAEAETVVRALGIAMHGEQQIMLPLLKLRNFDEYTTTHSLNVAVLSMGLAEWMGMDPQDVRGFGVAGLLHDLGKVRIPKEILVKPGKLTEEERAVMQRHPSEGAKIILESDEDLDLAAVVAYEHHIMINGGGYPTFRYPRDCHRASKLVHVCDVYDALRTNRPYRDAWPADRVLAYIEERAGTEFDPEVARAFVQMMREWEPRVAVVEEGTPLPAN